MNRKTEIEDVKRLGDKIGYGNMMHIASNLWTLSLKEKGYPESGAFIPALAGEVDTQHTAVTCGRIKECEHFLGLIEKLSWLKESEEHDLFVSMIKMRIEFLKQDDDVKEAITDTLKNLINEKEG